MISSDVIRGYIDTFILAVLREADSYGYQISKDIERISAGKYTIKETTLYSAIARLQKNGMIDSYLGDNSGGRQRTYYHINASGLAYFHEKCEEWALTQAVVDPFIHWEEQ